MLKLQQILLEVKASPSPGDRFGQWNLNCSLVLKREHASVLISVTSQSTNSFQQLLNRSRFPNYLCGIQFLLMLLIYATRGRYWFSKGDGFFYSNLSSKNSSGWLPLQVKSISSLSKKAHKFLQCFFTVFIVAQNPGCFMSKSSSYLWEICTPNNSPSLQKLENLSLMVLLLLWLLLLL